MKTLHMFAVGLVFLSLSGCARHQLYTLTVETIPAGAIVECDGMRLKGSPATLSFVKENLLQSLQQQTSNTVMPPSSCIAMWPSGAEANVKLFGGVDVAHTVEATGTIVRPANTPNAEMDYRYAQQLQNAKNAPAPE